MIIMLDEVYRPHDTQETKAFKDLQKDGWRIVSSWGDVGDSEMNAELVNQEKRHKVVLGWTNGITPLRFLSVPDGLF